MERIIVLFLCVSSLSATYLDIIPGTSVKEGEMVTIRCAEVYAYGFEMSSKITLQHNSSGLTQEATWKMLTDVLMYNDRWRLPRTVNKTVDADIVFTMIYQFNATIAHNKMQIRCFSSRTSETSALRKMLFVRKKPSVLNCVIKPPYASEKENTVRCWIVLGSPRATKIALEGSQVIKFPKRREYTTDTKYSYSVALFSWKIRARQLSEPTTFKIVLKNDFGSTSESYRLDVKAKKTTVVKEVIITDPTAKIVVEPDETFNLHVGDFIRCRIVNSTRKWRIKITLKREGINDSDVSFGENSTDYRVPKTTKAQEFMRYTCYAWSDGMRNLTSKSIQKWLFPRNHRTFLRFDEDKSVFLTGSTAAVTCHFLPRAGQTSIMNVSVVTDDNQVLMKTSYNGTGVTLVVNNLGGRFVFPECRNNMNLFVCSFKLTNLVTSDTKTKLRCETKTLRHLDMLEKVIAVEMPPTIGMLIPSQIIGNINDTINATCLISLGNPVAKDFSLDFANQKYKMPSTDVPTIKDNSGFEWKVLRVKRRLVFADQGTNLTCTASNRIGTAVAVSQIIMHQPTYNISVTPSPDATLRRNQTLTCSAYGYPLPDVSFTGQVRNKPFKVTSDYRNRYYRSVSGFVSMFQDDDFTMNCTAVNRINGQSYVKTKIVRYKPTKRIVSK